MTLSSNGKSVVCGQQLTNHYPALLIMTVTASAPGVDLKAVSMNTTQVRPS